MQSSLKLHKSLSLLITGHDQANKSSTVVLRSNRIIAERVCHTGETFCVVHCREKYRQSTNLELNFRQKFGKGERSRMRDTKLEPFLIIQDPTRQQLTRRPGDPTRLPDPDE